MLLLGHVSKIVSILLSKVSNCPNIDTSVCYCNYTHYHYIAAGHLLYQCLSNLVARLPFSCQSAIFVFLQGRDLQHCTGELFLTGC